VIDPEILRPGWLDVKIRIDRPDEQAARGILAKYVVGNLPINPDDLATYKGDHSAAASNMINSTTDYLYSEDEPTKFLEVTYQSGEKEKSVFPRLRLRRHSGKYRRSG
jgi:proteasome-associated ATPase